MCMTTRNGTGYARPRASSPASRSNTRCAASSPASRSRRRRKQRSRTAWKYAASSSLCSPASSSRLSSTSLASCIDDVVASGTALAYDRPEAYHRLHERTDGQDQEDARDGEEEALTLRTPRTA